MRLAQAIDWARFEAASADSYCEELGGPGKAIRLMVGLQYLKYAFNESDESLVEAARAHGIRLRQSYLRVGKRAAVQVGRYAHAKQFKRMRKKLRT